MTKEEQAAFVRAYVQQVDAVPKDKVEEFVRKQIDGEIIPFEVGQGSILDALGVWFEATKWQLEQGAKQ